MKWLGATVLVMALTGCGGTRSDVPKAAAAFAAADVRRVLAEQQAAWNRGDLDGFMNGYWRSDSLTFYSGGDVQRTWQGTLERYTTRWASGRDMGKLSFDLHDVTLLAPDVALVRGAWQVALADTTPHGLFTLILRDMPGVGWRIVHDHTSVP